MKKVISIIGTGPAGIYTAYELCQFKDGFTKKGFDLEINLIDKGNPLELRVCPSQKSSNKKCTNCKSCSVMNGFGGAGAKSDGKFNITNDFGGYLHEKVGKEKAISLMNYVDSINTAFLLNESVPKLFKSKDSKFHKICVQNNLNLLNADIRHLGTDLNYILLERLYSYLKNNGVNFFFNTEVSDIVSNEDKTYEVKTSLGNTFHSDYVVVSVGRSGSSWLEKLCKSKDIKTKSSKVDIGVRVELPFEVFSELTDDLYESKITYKTSFYEDIVRTFCMNPRGYVVEENTNGIITVNGHSFGDISKGSNNTNFALLVGLNFTEPFNDSNDYGKSIALLSNMLGNGVIVQRFGDLLKCKRSTVKRLSSNTVVPTLKAEPGDLSLVLPKRILDDIIEMIKALDKVAPGTANPDTLLYGVEVKFYNMEVDIDENLAIPNKNIFIIGDGSGITHSLSQSAASGCNTARVIFERCLE